MNIAEFVQNNNKFDVKEYKYFGSGTIYFICDNDGTIIYIGSSKSLHTRISSHQLALNYRHKRIFFFPCSLHTYKKIEQELIEKIEPKHNFVYNNAALRKKHSLRKTDISRAKLNSDLIRKKIEESNHNMTWLAKEIGTSRALVSYWLKSGSLNGVHEIAKVFKVSYKSLIK